MKFLMRAVLVLALIVGSVTSVALFRLERGPIPLPFLAKTIERNLAAELNQTGSIRIGSTALARGPSGLGLQLDDITIRQADGSPLLSIPSANVTLSTAGLWSGRLAVERVELVRPRVNLRYTDGGQLAISVGAAAGSDSSASPSGDQTFETSSAQTLEGKSAGGDSFDLVRTITTLGEQARGRQTSSAFLRGIGLRDAVVIVDNGRRATVWNLPSLDVGLRHKSRHSQIEGRAEIATIAGPVVIDFETVETVRDARLAIAATITGANPRGLARQVPALAAFDALDLPFDGQLRASFDGNGSLADADLKLTASSGRVVLNADTSRQLQLGIDNAGVSIKFDRTEQAFLVERAFVAAELGAVELNGRLTRVTTTNAGREAAGGGDGRRGAEGAAVWFATFDAVSGHLGSDRVASSAGLPLERLRIEAQIDADRGSLLQASSVGRAGGVEFQLAVEPGQDLANSGAGVTGQLGRIPLQTLLAAWPPSIAPAARAYVTKNVKSGTIRQGQIAIGSPLTEASSTGAARTPVIVLDAEEIEVAATAATPQIAIPKATVRIGGNQTVIEAPTVTIGRSPGRVTLQAMEFRAERIHEGTHASGALSFRLQSGLKPVAQLIASLPNTPLKTSAVNISDVDGKIDARLRLNFPVAQNLALSEVRTEGQLRISDGRVRKVFANHDVSGLKLEADISDKAIDVNGAFLLAGIPVRITGQHFPNQSAEQQPPLRLSANLDDADRLTLGIKLQDSVFGSVPIEVLVSRSKEGAWQPSVRADLTPAEVAIESLAWAKPPGQKATFTFEPRAGAAGTVELTNVRLSGDTIAAQGTITIGANSKVQEFTFPEFIVNTVSQLSIDGKMRADNVWDIRARGSRFDAREIFRRLFNPLPKPKRPLPADKPGVDLVAEVDTVIGHNDTNLRNLRLKTERRIINGSDVLTSLDLFATHARGETLRGTLRVEQDRRRRFAAQSDNAGDTLRTISFYPNAAGGKLGFEMFLDMKDDADRTGVLVVNEFSVLGDQVVSEVFQSADQPQVGQPARPRVTRQQFEFDWMRIPFKMGSAQFVMNDAQIRGPLLGASWRGRIDFAAQQLQVSGTYVPAQALNSAIRGIPVLGPLLTGPRGEGIFGVNFSVAGPSQRPEVVVHPLSMIAPGVLREIFQLGPEQYQITPKAVEPTAPRTPDRRSSSSPPVTSGTAPTLPNRQNPTRTLSDWSRSKDGSPSKAPTQ